MEKEKRRANFTRAYLKAEMDLLIDIVLKYKHIIENKRIDATTWKDKNEAWEKISSEFNAASKNFPRFTKTIRSKYDTIRKILAKNARCSRANTKIGGGQCSVTLTPYEEKILSLIPNAMVSLESKFDNDN